MNFLQKIYRWLFSSLANQLLVTYLLVIMISLFTVSLWALLTIKSESIDNLHTRLEVQAVNLSLEIDNDLTLDSPDALRRIKDAVDRYAFKYQTSITVVNSEGHVLADSMGGVEAPSGANISNQSEINDALAGIISFGTRKAPSTHTNWLYVAYPVRSAGESAGVIRVGMPLTDIERRLNSDLHIFLKIIVATGVVTVLISLWLARRVNRPVKEMSAAARKIALSGDLSELVPASRSDEIGELGLSFNQMIGRLREQERVRQEFIANASHELKTPTMAIGSVVEALQAGAAEDPKLRQQFLCSLERMVDRQTSLLQDLLDISRLDGGAGFNWQDDLNLGQLVADSVEQVRPQADKKQIQLSNTVNSSINASSNPSSTTPPSEALVIEGNSIQLQRALVNILTNAINYTPQKGAVSVSARVVEPGRIDIRIQDNGQGIDPQDLPHIFERFYRADKARTRAEGTTSGSGLGLAITQEIIARHHGTVEVESVAGKGSTFTIRLPISQKD